MTSDRHSIGIIYISMGLLLILTSVLCPMARPGTGNALRARLTCRGTDSRSTGNNTLTEFADGSEDIDVWFLDGGENDTVDISLPGGINITRAEMTICGKGVVGDGVEKTLTYTNIIDNRAWWGGMNGQDPVQTPADYMSTPFGPNAYGNVALSDNIRYTTTMRDGRRPYQLFEFTVNVTELEELKVHYEGRGYFAGGMAFARNAAWFYIFNHNIQVWEEVDHELQEVMMDDDFYLDGTYRNGIGDYLDNSNRLYLLGAGPVSIEPPFNDWIATDFVSVTVKGRASTFCEDPALDAGDDGAVEWEYEGEFKDEVVIGETHGFRGALQEAVDGDGSRNDVVVTIALSSLSAGILSLGNLLIEYEHIPVNGAPALLVNIPPSGLNFPEDSDGGMGLLSLPEHFDDDGGFPNLTFSISGNDPELTATVNETTYSLDFRSGRDFFGSRGFRVRATDAEGLYAESGIFYVTVTPTNDAPYLALLGEHADPAPWALLELEAPEGVVTEFHYVLRDVDGDVPSAEIAAPPYFEDVIIVKGSVDKTMEGKLCLSPEDEHIGTVNLTLILDDLNGTRGDADGRMAYNISLTVQNTNDAPVINVPEEVVGKQESWLNLSVGYYDVDLLSDPGERMGFSCNFSDHGIGRDAWDFDTDTGNFSFLPDNSHVGTYAVNFTVEDRKGKAAWAECRITVKNVNDAPTAGSIGIEIEDADPRTPREENLTVTFNSIGSDDPDLVHGEVLVHRWDFDGDGVYDEEGTYVQWTFSGPGNHTVLLAVFDSGIPILYNTTTIIVEVLAPVGPDGDDDSGDPGGKEDDDGTGGGGSGGRDSGSMGTVLIVVICIVVLLLVAGFIVIFVLARRGEGKDAVGASSPTGHDAPPLVQPRAAGGIAQHLPYEQPPVISTAPLPPSPAQTPSVGRAPSYQPPGQPSGAGQGRPSPPPPYPPV